MTNSSTSLPKPFLFRLSEVLICLLLFKVCNTSDIPNLNLSSVTSDPITRGSIIKGETDNGQLGYSANSAGDIDNDGFEDLMIEVPGTNNSQGAVYVIYSGESSSLEKRNLSLESLDPATTGFTITWDSVGHGFESSTSLVEDINDDGYDDIILQASSQNNGQEVTSVIYGGERSSMSNIDLSTTILDPVTTGFKFSGNISDFLANPLKIPENKNEVGSDEISIIALGKDSDKQATSLNENGDPKSNICPIYCNRCRSPFSCTECTNPYLLYKSQCVESCPDDSFPSSGECEVKLILDSRQLIPLPVCGINCLECSDSQCIDCVAGYVPSGTACIPESCPTGCVSCSSSSTCTTCSSGYYLSGVQCGQTCPTGTYANTALLTCSTCPTGCVSCSSSSICTMCSNGYYLYLGQCTSSCPADTYPSTSGSCQTCPNGCSTCSSSSICTACSNGYYLSSGQCVTTCPVASVATNGVCQACSLNCDVCSDPSTCTTCSSSYFLSENQCVSNCPVTTFGMNGVCQACPANCDKCMNASACVACSASYFLSMSQCVMTCPALTFPSSSTGTCEDCPLHCSSCISQTSCKTCDDGYTLSNSLCVKPAAAPLQTEAQASKAVSSAVTGAGSVLCVGSPTFPITALVSQIVQNTRYLNLTVTNELAEIYKTWNTNMISWDPPNTFSKLENFKTSPVLFSQYGIGSSFMTNFWPTFMTIVIGLAILSVSFVLKILFERGQYRGRLFSVVKKLVAGSFNFVIVQVYGCLDDILFDLVLDMKTNPFDTFFSWTSVFAAFGFLAIGCSLVFMNLRVVNKYQSVKAKGLVKKDMSIIETFNENNKYWELFYSEFNDEDFWSQSALALFIIRGTLSSLVIAACYDYPVMQTSFLVMLDGAVLLFVVTKKPFKQLRGKLAQYYFEIVTLLVHMCTFILALQDTFPTSSETLRKVLCTGIIYLNTTLVAGSLFFMGIEIYDIIRLKQEANQYKKPQDIANHLAIEETSSTVILTTQAMNQLTEGVEIEAQRKPNLIHTGSLETSNLFSENNNRSFSGMRILKPARTLDLSMNVNDSALQDIEVGDQIQRARRNQNRLGKRIQQRSRVTKIKQQEQQRHNELFLRNPARHIRDLKKPVV